MFFLYQGLNISQATYVGCFKDNSQSRDLPYQFWDTSLPMTVEYCVDYCLSNGYSLAGLQAS